MAATRRSRWAQFTCMALAAAAWMARVALEGLSELLIVLGIVIVLSAGIWTYAIRQRNRTFEGAPYLWKGPIVFRRKNLLSLQFPNVRLKRAYLRRLVGFDLCSGYLEVSMTGLHWSAGSWLTLGLGVGKGSIDLLWAEVKDASVTDAPGRVSSLGGELLLFVHGNVLSGEFMGSQAALREAISKGQSGTSIASDHSASQKST